MPPPLLIENGTLLSPGEHPAVRRGQAVLIEDGLIARVAPKAKFTTFRGQRLDAAGQVVMPGLINAHTHCYSSLARGLTKTKPARDFNGVLRNLWWRLDSALTTADCHYSALVALIDSIRHGTTTIIDHHASPNAIAGSLDAVASAVKATGLRACLCYEVSDRDGPRAALDGLAENVHFIRQCQTGDGTHLQALFGLHASFTLSDSTLRKAASLGHELQTGFHIHVAEAAADQAATRRTSGWRVVERLEKFGILGERSIAAHGVHVSPREIDRLAAAGTAVVHNPQSNLNNAVGIADVIALRRHGVLLGLGTDAMTANLLEELRVALWAQHHRRQLPAVGFCEVTDALFRANAEVAGRIFGRRFGAIQPGCVGDLAIFDYDPPTPLDDQSALGHVVFGLSQAVVDTTIVGGRILMANRRLRLDLDEARVHARARELAKHLWQRL